MFIYKIKLKANGKPFSNPIPLKMNKRIAETILKKNSVEGLTLLDLL